MAQNISSQGTINITANVTTTPGGQSQPNLTSAIQNGSQWVYPVVLGNGDNTITIPAGISQVMFEFPPNSTVTKTLKGNTLDTGIPLGINDNGKLPVPLLTTTQAWIITTNGADNGQTIFYGF